MDAHIMECALTSQWIVGCIMYHTNTHTHAHNIHTLCNDITANCTIGGCYTYTEFRGLFSYREGREEFKRNLGKRTQLSIERLSFT